MRTIEELQRQIGATRDMESVVRTMKSMAAVNIRQYEQAARSLTGYVQTVRLGLRALLRNHPRTRIHARRAPLTRVAAILFGTDQGMCGPLNEQVVDHGLTILNELDVAADRRFLIVVGERAAGLLPPGAAAKVELHRAPGSLSGAGFLVGDLLPRMDDFMGREPGAHLYLFYSRQTSAASGAPADAHPLPVDRAWLDRLQDEPWPGRSLPLFTMAPDRLFSSLIRQYLFAAVMGALVDTMASENANRLAAMQGAEKNIGRRLDELSATFHQRRQMRITEELLDIVSGFEALKVSA